MLRKLTQSSRLTKNHGGFLCLSKQGNDMSDSASIGLTLCNVRAASRTSVHENHLVQSDK